MSKPLSPGRLEAFSDGVIAVIITIMVLELQVPPKNVSNQAGLHALVPLLTVYLLSFVQTGIYWVNHHYLVDDLRARHPRHPLVQPRLPLLPLALPLRHALGPASAASRPSPSRSTPSPAPSPP